MNERIQKWLENHLVRSEYTEFGWQECHRYEFDEHELEKFAELIVRECVEQGKQIQLQTVSNGSKDYVDGREMGIEVFMNQIKKHFGVEK